MDNIEQLLTLIGDIYDAALDPALWLLVMERASSFVGGSGAGLWTRDWTRDLATAVYDYGMDPRYKQLYFESHNKLDPLREIYLCQDIGEVVSNSMVLSHEEFVQTRFYQEWAKPQGFIDNVLTTVDKSATSMAGFAVFRREEDGFADEAARQRMRLLVPHVRRSVLIGKVVDLKTAEAASLGDTFDGLSAGMFLVDERGRILRANISGRTLLADRSLMHAVGDKLAINDQEAEQALREVFLAAGKGDVAVGVKGIAVTLIARDGERHVAHVLPLTSGARRRVDTAHTAVAAVFVQKAALATPSPPEAIAKAYKLTPMELRVLLAIVEVGGVPEVSDALGIAESTVKTHLLRLYAKTGASRQADLVKLIAGFASPLRD
jgi:DNA-binding CsgD family transcriptional regulator